MISIWDFLGEKRLEGEGLDGGVSSSATLAMIVEAWPAGGVVGEGREERVRECGVLAAVLAVSSNSTCKHNTCH